VAESYREMEQRHAAMDDQEYRQENDARWAGLPEYVEVADPDAVYDCTNCRYADPGVGGYWCKALLKFVAGTMGCSGGPWDPKDEEVA